MDYTKEIAKALEDGNLSRARMAVGQMFRSEGVASSYAKIRQQIEGSDIWESSEDVFPEVPASKAEAEEELKNQLAALTLGFSKGRMDYILKLDAFVNPETQIVAQKPVQKLPERGPKVVERRIIKTTQQKVGVGVAAVGAVATVVGVATSTTALTVGGVVGVAAGAVIYLTDRGE